MKWVFVAALACLLMTGCDTKLQPDAQVNTYLNGNADIVVHNGYFVNGYRIEAADGGYVITVEVKAK